MPIEGPNSWTQSASDPGGGGNSVCPLCAHGHVDAIPEAICPKHWLPGGVTVATPT